eukprot:scaffold4633_cov114-Isochrysis_galbana.AAC.11
MGRRGLFSAGEGGRSKTGLAIGIRPPVVGSANGAKAAADLGGLVGARAAGSICGAEFKFPVPPSHPTRNAITPPPPPPPAFAWPSRVQKWRQPLRQLPRTLAQFSNVVADLIPHE